MSENNITSSKLSQMTNIKNKKYLWLFLPMQLFIHGQWWSYICTQRLQISQCLDLFGFTMWHSGQQLKTSLFFNNCIRSAFFSTFPTYPGFRSQIKQNSIKLITISPKNKRHKKSFRFGKINETNRKDPPPYMPKNNKSYRLRFYIGLNAGLILHYSNKVFFNCNI